MDTREARCGEQGCAGARESGRGQVSGKDAKEKSRVPVEAKGTVNDGQPARRYWAVEVDSVEEASVRTIDGASMMTVLVDVAESPDWSARWRWSSTE
jgi:hypothetical protein